MRVSKNIVNPFQDTNSKPDKGNGFLNSYSVCLNMVAQTAKQFDLSVLPKCFDNVFVLTTQKSAEHSLVLKIDIHCVC